MSPSDEILSLMRLIRELTVKRDRMKGRGKPRSCRIEFTSVPIYEQARVDLNAIREAVASDVVKRERDKVMRAWCQGYQRGGLYKHFYTGTSRLWHLIIRPSYHFTLAFTDIAKGIEASHVVRA